MNTRNVIAIRILGGAKSWNCSITQVAAVHFIEGTELESYHSLVKPYGEGDINHGEIANQGLDYNTLVRDGVELVKVQNSFCTFLWDAHRKLGKEVESVTVAHELAAYNFPLLKKFFDGMDFGFDPPNTVDTFSFAKNLMGLGAIRQQGWSLSALAGNFGIEIPRLRGPVCDARACGQLYLALAEEVSRCH